MLPKRFSLMLDMEVGHFDSINQRDMTYRSVIESV